jgi:sigma-B regulation protein RsbU (phosphoserine phosphatase)
MADSSRTDQFADLRHDLCTPINQILGYSEMLEEDAAADYPAFVDDLRKIQQAAMMMLALVRQRITVQYLQAEESCAADRSSSVSAIPDFAFDLLPPADDGAAHSSCELAPKSCQCGRILVVDDDVLNRDLLASRLTRQGHIVSVAVDGDDALNCARNQELDLILLDVMMPRLDGYQTLLALKDDDSLHAIPVIMISALDELSSVVRCIEAGAQDYLPKPFNPTLLRARVGACLREKARHDEEVALYQNLLKSQQCLQRELARADQCLRAADPLLRINPELKPLFEVFEAMTGAVQRRETDLRATMASLEIKINRAAVQTQVGSIVADPSFNLLSQRAKAMRERRQRRGGAE